jgi:hypothetical protein
LLIIDSLLQGYHLSFSEAMSLTLPQIIASNYGADVNHRRGEERYEWKKQREGNPTAKPRKQQGNKTLDSDPFIAKFGKRLSELNTEETMKYQGDIMREFMRVD